jgi:hypothetical protein
MAIRGKRPGPGCFLRPAILIEVQAQVQVQGPEVAEASANGEVRGTIPR